MTAVTIKGLEELRARLTAFSDRRFNAAIRTALSRTGVIVRDKLRQQMAQEIDRPTPYTLNSLYSTYATDDKLQVMVRFKDESATTKQGTPATYYMLPNVEGGKRRIKRFEQALSAAGALPSGWFIVPGHGAPLDAYGNVSRGTIIQVLSQLRIQLLAGSSRNMSFNARDQINAQRKAGGRFFVVKPGKKTQPGIYQREFFGRDVTPVFVFVRGATYRKRFKFYEKGVPMASQHLQEQITRAVQEHIDRMAKR